MSVYHLSYERKSKGVVTAYGRTENVSARTIEAATAKLRRKLNRNSFLRGCRITAVTCSR